MKKSLLFVALTAVMALTGCSNEPNPEEGRASMSLDPMTLNFASDSGTQTVSVTSNRDWKVASKPEWISISVDGEDITGTVQKASAKPVKVSVTVIRNTELERSAEILFNGGTLAKKTLVVNQDGVGTYTKVADIRDLLSGHSDTDVVTISEGTVIKGYIISNSELSNLVSKKSVYVQDETGGINIYCTEDSSFKFGDLVVINLGGQKLKYYGGSPEIDGLPLSKFKLINGGNAVTPLKVDVKDFMKNKYEGRYVSIDDIQVAEADLFKTWVVDGKHTSINVIAKTGETFVVQSSKYSSFKDERVSQGSGTISGIASNYNGGIQLVFAQKSDYSGLISERFTVKYAEVNTSKISEVVNASSGAQITLEGVTVVSTSITKASGTECTSFLVEDADKDHLLIFGAPKGSVKVSDVVTVKGTLSTYSSMPQISGPTVTVTSTGAPVSYPQPQDITDCFDSFTSTTVKYVSFVGKLDSEVDDYFNVVIEGATKVGCFLEPDVIDVSSLRGVPNVCFSGYYLYHNGTGSKYCYIMLTKADAGTGPYILVSPVSQKVSALTTSATFTVESNTSWTCAVEPSTASVDWTNGEGNKTVTVSLPVNEDPEKSITYTVTVSTNGITKTATIIQSKAAPLGSRIAELTNEEICKALTDGGASTTSYIDMEFKSNSGVWKGNVSGLKTNTFLQLRAKSGSCILSPEFEGNVYKVELAINSKTVERTFYCIPASVTLPSGDYNKDSSIIANAYGSVKSKKSVEQTLSIEFSAETNQFKLIMYDGAAYIDSIKVYYAK